jgi:hypothetical protein
MDILSDTYNSIAQILQFIVSLPETIATIISYPIITALSTIIAIGGDFVGHVTGPIGPIIQIQLGTISIVQAVLGNLLPLGWMSLLICGIMIVVIVRLYHFAKDISIMGFKI